MEKCLEELYGKEGTSTEDPLVRLELSGFMFWKLFGAALVFFMQCGFALLESGCVQAKNAKNILTKNIMDACLGALLWYFVGHAFAFGDDFGHFIGTTWNDFSGCGDYAKLMFQWAFAATSATIVSGAVAERCQFPAYLIYSAVMTGLVYPLVAHWSWTENGWLVSKLPAAGFFDYAGSGVVHITGGSAALVGAAVIGPRHGRFVNGSAVLMRGHSTVLSVIGVFILWFGWYGFNSVSRGGFLDMYRATRVSACTTLAAASGGCGALLLHLVHFGAPDVMPALNGILAGLVSISAGCSVVEPYIAAMIGLLSSPVYYYSSALLERFLIDDPLDASAVHLSCGLWGVISVGLFANQDYMAEQGLSTWGLIYSKDFTQLGSQLAGAAAICGWSLACSSILFLLLKRANLLRVPLEDECNGLDKSYHGGEAYYHSFSSVPQLKVLQSLKLPSPDRSRSPVPDPQPELSKPPSSKVAFEA
uniref:Ammonium transporter n=1 Tax=Tetraselmis sp. GSL018 TaxID=582737 RepID=A0A061RAT2_9CHLO|mmetsp:Transcript_31249/g.74283  ORF Transcript_31249/g.74283 Transcript_31249/m.74283 type:complete len:476 (+) Transcript_31249:285-1712(+)|eukprot:CAMPEP_0177590198 /NCGR_PEP_ID=MMETSP0419_2-20121207/7253_1 /TAXON_ID=582737 /ORGANISM="Tetraselmis sp., Strain GSL018" /LENGTH=475 /DNA_ID=CAMNT_0019080691 /DNA_START=237 /DNA_END=1664 /DNA_ORIENTATION=+